MAYMHTENTLDFLQKKKILEIVGSSDHYLLRLQYDKAQVSLDFLFDPGNA